MSEGTGRIAYEAYAEFTGGRSLVTGADLPTWPDLPEAIRLAWTAAAAKVLASR
jgi:hypothetical protein